MVLTMLGLFFWPIVDTAPVAAAESRAASALRELHSILESYKSGRQHAGYPPTFPNVDSVREIQSIYRFEYVPSLSAGGSIDSYVIQATPLRRSCGCTLSFTIAHDGLLHYTREDRPAANFDEQLR
jgi:hypothetical protein